MTDRAIELVKQAQFQLGQAYPAYQVLRTLEELHTYLLEQSVPTPPPVQAVVVEESQNTNPGPSVLLETPTFLSPNATVEELKAFVRAKREAPPVSMTLASPKLAEPSEPTEPPKRRGRAPKTNPPGHAIPNV